MTAKERLAAAAPKLLAVCKAIEAYDCQLGAGLLPQLREAIALAEVGPLMARVQHRRATIEGLRKAREKGVKLGRPGIEMTGARRRILAIWRAGEPREPLRVLAEALRCSVSKASEIARSEL